MANDFPIVDDYSNSAFEFGFQNDRFLVRRKSRSDYWYELSLVSDMPYGEEKLALFPDRVRQFMWLIRKAHADIDPSFTWHNAEDARAREALDGLALEVVAIKAKLREVEQLAHKILDDDRGAANELRERIETVAQGCDVRLSSLERLRSRLSNAITKALG